MNFFKLAAEFCNDAYGCELLYDEVTDELCGFVCPSCGGFLYDYVWTDKETENWMVCPFCGDTFGV